MKARDFSLHSVELTHSKPCLTVLYSLNSSEELQALNICIAVTRFLIFLSTVKGFSCVGVVLNLVW